MARCTQEPYQLLPRDPEILRSSLEDTLLRLQRSQQHNSTTELHGKWRTW